MIYPQWLGWGIYPSWLLWAVIDETEGIMALIVRISGHQPAILFEAL